MKIIYRPDNMSLVAGILAHYTKAMDPSPLYQQIVESIRQEIFTGTIKPGDRLPAIRKMTEKWQCNTGTIHHAYQELARLGLVVSHAGKGTKVVDQLPDQGQTPLRRAMLFNRTEAFLLEILTAGYAPEEVEQSLRVALERWQMVSTEPQERKEKVLRFVGSHDPAIALLAAHYHEVTNGFTIQLSFSGSVGGLVSLAQKKADLAGCHLWDPETDTYNETFVRQYLPGQRVALIALADRRMGFILPPGNPRGLKTLEDLGRKKVRFVNRQPGSGTRLWLDTQTQRAGIDAKYINGYQDEKMTHSEVARAVIKGQADVGLGVETVALSFGLDFLPLTAERYDLVIPADNWDLPCAQLLRAWLSSPQARAAIFNLGGYDIKNTGSVTWIG